MTNSLEVEPLDPAHFLPWPLAPGARLGWRDGGRWCTYLARIADIRTGAEPEMNALGADLVPFHHYPAPVIGGGVELFGQMTAGYCDDPAADTAVGWVRVGRDEVGVVAVGQLFRGVDPSPYRAAFPSTRWAPAPDGIGWVLMGMGWPLPPGTALPDGRVVPEPPVPGWMAIPRRGAARPRGRRGMSG